MGFAQDFDKDALVKLQNTRMHSWGTGSIASWAHGVLKREDGTIWLTTADGVIRFDGKQFLSIAEPNKKYTFFRKIFELDGVIYLGDIDKPLHFVNTSDSIPKISRVNWPENISNELFIWSVYEHHDGRVFLVDNKGLIYNYNGDAKIDVFFELPQSVLNSPELKHTARYIRSDPFDKDKVWVCSLHGMFHLNMNEKSYQFYGPEEGVGLHEYNGTEGFTFYDHIQMGENIWISTYANGLVRFNTKTKKYKAFRYEPPYDDIEIGTNFMRSHVAYDDQNIIVGGRILKIFNTVNNQFYDFFRGHDNFDPTVGLAVDIHRSDDEFYILALGSMDTFLPENNLFQSGKLNSDQLVAEESFISQIARTKDNKLIITTNKNNKFYWDYFDAVLRPVENNEVFELRSESHPEMKQFGFKDDTIFVYDSKGKTSSTIFIKGITGINGVTKDLQNQLWIKSNEGLVKYNLKDESYSLYNQVDGLWNYVWSDPGIISTFDDGSIFASSGMTFAYFNPAEIPPKNNERIQPYIYKLDVFNETVSLSYELNEQIDHTLSPGDNYFTIHYSSLIENPGQELEYQYQLEGFDEDWISAGNNNTSTYSKVPPGNYNFLLRAKYPGGTWRNSNNELSLDLKPTFTQSLIFKLLIALLVLSLLYAVYRYRTYHLLKEQQIKSDFKNQLSEVKLEALRSQMNPHFLFNSLNSIDNYILSNRPQEASEYLSKFSKLIRNILDFSKHKQISLVEELSTSKLYIEMEQLRFSDKFEYQINVDKAIKQEKVMIPPLILQPYIENAIWHGLLHKEDKGHLSITIAEQGGKLKIVIDDDGIGRKKAMSIKSKSATKHKSHGMKITEARIRILNELHELGGTVEILDKYDTSSKPAGTCVSIHLPVLGVS